jgi:ABC-type spermidine/putrescine transport system permease subunit I
MISASTNLGASALRSFGVLVVPIVRIEVLLIFLYSFGFAVSDTYSNQVLNNHMDYLFADVISDRLRIADWPLAAAGSFTVVLVEILLALFANAALDLLVSQRGRKCAG